MVDEVPDCAEVILQLFREGERLANKPGDALAKGVVESFYEAGLAAALRRWPMPTSGKHRFVRRPEVGVGGGALAVDGRQRPPQAASALGIAVSDVHSDDLPRLYVQSQPDPLLVAFLTDERPQLITLDGQVPPFLAVTSTTVRIPPYFLLT